MSEQPSDTFATVFIRQIYFYCNEWLRQHPYNRDAEFDFNIGMLCHICNPSRWRNKSPTKNEMDAITTLLGTVIEPCFREKVPDLWEQIDRASTTFAIYTMPNFKGFAPDGSIIEEEQPEPNEAEESVVARQERAHPLVEVENLIDDDDEDDYDDDDDDDDDDKHDLIELPDNSERVVEKVSTPKRKRAKKEAPPAPRVLRKKIILWSTTTTSQNKENPDTSVPKK